MCRGCYDFTRHRPGPCACCRRTLPLKKGYCRCCWLQAALQAVATTGTAKRRRTSAPPARPQAALAPTLPDHQQPDRDEHRPASENWLTGAFRGLDATLKRLRADRRLDEALTCGPDPLWTSARPLLSLGRAPQSSQRPRAE